MNSLFDTHCHIQVIGHDGTGHTSKLWQSSRLTLEDVISGAHKSKVDELMAVGCDLQESEQALALAKNEKSIYASIGIHPHEADRYVNDQAKLNKFSALASNPDTKAIGECGLDYYYNHSIKKNQIKILEFQIELAIKYKLPLIFHVRDAYDDFWPIFNKYFKGNNTPAVLHSFTDNMANLSYAISKGLYIGVNGIATFTKDVDQLAMYKSIPLDNLVLETDAPYLAPVPHRGSVNEPKNVVEVAKFLSSLKKVDLSELSLATTTNARSLFKVNK